MVADLMPASSPASRSTTSALKPARSAQRRYMRMSIWAQSWDSVPPAPGWMDRIAFFLSCGRERTTFSSKASTSSPSCRRLSWISAVTLSSPASVAISQSRRVSSARPGEVLEGADGAGQLGALLHERLRLAGVLPEARRATSRRRSRPGGLPWRGGQRCPRRSSSRLSSSATSRFSSPSMTRMTSGRMRRRRRPPPARAQP